jgi:choline transport protein
MLTGTLTAIPIMVAAMFTISDPERVMNASFPAVELIYQVTGNRSLAIFLSVWLIVIFACKSWLRTLS